MTAPSKISTSMATALLLPSLCRVVAGRKRQELCSRSLTARDIFRCCGFRHHPSGRLGDGSCRIPPDKFSFPRSAWAMPLHCRLFLFEDAMRSANMPDVLAKPDAAPKKQATDQHCWPEGVQRTGLCKHGSFVDVGECCIGEPHLQSRRPRPLGKTNWGATGKFCG